VGAPNKGILKQRATLLRKSKSTSNIISLNIRSAQVIFWNFLSGYGTELSAIDSYP
jgi:hypothetical protein